MTILIKPVQRANPQDAEAPKKWYPVQQTTKQVDETEVAMEIADETTLNPSEALMAVRQLRKIVLRNLLDSKSVRLGNWGSFYATLSTEGAPTKEALTARNVKSVNIIFQPGEELKAAMQHADFAWINKMMEGRNPSATPEQPGGGDQNEDILNDDHGGGEAPDPLL